MTAPTRRLLAVGVRPTATIAIGLAPAGVVAIGVAPRGVVSIGLVSFGSVAAFGLLSVAPVADAVFYACAAATWTHRYGDSLLARPHLLSPRFLAEPALVTLLTTLVALAARHLLLRRRKVLAARLGTFVATVTTDAGDAPDELFIEDIAVDGDMLRLTSGNVTVSAFVSHDLRVRARACGRHAPRLVRLQKDELRDDATLDFRHAPALHSSYTVLELRQPEDAPKLALANLHVLAAAVAFTFALAATLSYAFAGH